MLETTGLLKRYEHQLKKIAKKRDQFGESNRGLFNFFTTISDTYNREGFHSYIIDNIFNPSTNGIINGNFINVLIDGINQLKPELEIKHFNSKGTEFIREYEVKDSDPKEKIDFLITSKKDAIIIESKLNGAGDQPNQLQRYYRSIKELEYNIVAVVYIPLIKKRPDSEFTKNYGFKKRSDFEEISEEVNKKLVVLPAISYRDEVDLSYILHNCIKELESQEESEEKQITVVYLKQYINLLEKLGKEEMIRDEQLGLIKELYKSSDDIKSFKEIAEAWSDRVDLLTEIIRNELVEKHGFSVRCEDNDQDTVVKKISDRVCIGVDYESLGFMTIEPGDFFKKKEIKLLNKIIDNVESEILGKNDSHTKEDEVEYIGRKLKLEETTSNLPELVKLVNKTIKGMEKAFKEI